MGFAAVIGASGSAPTILEALLDYYEKEPVILLATTMMSVLLAGAFLIVVVRAISKAGTIQPPRQVLALLVALIGLVSLLGVILRPEVDALAVAAGTAIGALAGALATSFSPGGIAAAKDQEEGVPPLEEGGDDAGG